MSGLAVVGLVLVLAVITGWRVIVTNRRETGGGLAATLVPAREWLDIHDWDGEIAGTKPLAAEHVYDQDTM